MKKVLPFILIVFCILSCERPAHKKYEYDLFPLNVGNEYHYSEKLRTGGVIPCTYAPIIFGNKRWKIISQSVRNDIIFYEFEEILYNRDSCLYCNYDTIIYELEADTNTFILTENPVSGEIAFHELYFKGSVFQFEEISFQRFWNEKINIITESQSFGSDHHRGSVFQFAADSGIIYIDFYNTSTMGKSYFYTCNLDSLNLIP